MIKDYFIIIIFLIASSTTLAQSIVLSGANNTISNNATTTASNNLTDYGLFDINSGAKSRTFKIKNEGSQNLVLGSVPVSFAAGSSATFVITNQPSGNTTISPGASVNFTIAFDPTAQVTSNATVRVSSNDAAKNPYSFKISGQGSLIYPDTDGDGVSNNYDLDDDNDGLPDSVEQLACLSVTNSKTVETVFLNETFGTGDNRARINGTTAGVTSTYCYEDGTTAQASDECNTVVDLNDGKYTVHYSVTDGNGITQISNSGPDLASWADSKWYQGEDHTPNDVKGRMAVFNASHTPGVFYETTVNGIIPNVPVNYSFWVINIDNKDSAFPSSSLPRILPNLTVRFLTSDYSTVLGSFNTGNINRCSAPNNNCDLSIWKQFLTSININQSDFVIQFINNAPGGSGNDLALDDIKITQTLCDLDGDGVADILDLDNDNDGIPNIVEARMISNPDSDKDATTKGPNWVDSNNNGWNDLFEFSGVSPVDTDGDGTPDYLDLDSDNDTIFDAVEYDGKGDVDVNGDGVGNGMDIDSGIPNDKFDGDGILGIIDTNDDDADANDFGMYGYPNPLDTDGLGLPDYLDVYNNLTTIYDIKTTIYAALDANNDGKIDGNTDIDKDGIIDAFDTNTNYFGSPRNLMNKYSLYFDGRNDYIEESVNLLSGLSQSTLMAWIKIDDTYNNEGYIMGQDKFFIKINSQKRPSIEVNGTSITLTGETNSLPTNKWVHIAAVYEGPNNSQTLRLYINGELKDSKSATPVIQASANNIFRIGRNPNTNATGYFKGEIDEVRVFNAALSTDQIQRMVYQELKDSNMAMGEMIPLYIPSFSASSVLRYYRMDAFKDDIVDNLTTPSIDVTSGAKIYNIQKVVFQTAPLPYLTIANGNWNTEATWKYGSVWDITSIVRPWSIVHVQHNITAGFDIENLGLLIDTNKKIAITGDVLLKNSWYLKLNGKLDLEGRSQLIQTTESVLEPTSSGSLERDQQGVKNLYNYNYWSSPVSTINNSINNNGYTVAGVMKDGTSPANIQNINWISGYDGASTSPLSLAGYWIFKFQNLSNVYANWTSVGPNGTLLSGQGYTLKGSGVNSIGGIQNYTFVGKPNNGTIINPVAANNINLSGNPYPSAIDSHEFIRDNISGSGSSSGTSNAIKGTIYFWQHANENNSHYLADYVGGYATLNLTGGVAPIYSAGTASIGTSNRIPNRFIPVGQGFFVAGNTIGGNITFKNSQRAFKLETDNAINYGSNPMFRTASTDTTNIDFKKVRLGFTTANNYHRQMLLGFMEDHATEGIDAGYDAESIDSNVPTDIYFKVGDSKLIIQGVDHFQDTKMYPIGIKTNENGIVSINIDGLENFEPSQQFYIFDNETNVYHNITQNPLTIQLAEGVYDNRFSLRFKDATLSNEDFEALENSFNVYVDGQDNIMVQNKNDNISIEKLTVYSILGQVMHVENKVASTTKINTNGFATGTYIVQIAHSNGTISKKVIIN